MTDQEKEHYNKAMNHAEKLPFRDKIQLCYHILNPEVMADSSKFGKAVKMLGEVIRIGTQK